MMLEQIIFQTVVYLTSKIISELSI